MSDDDKREWRRKKIYTQPKKNTPTLSRILYNYGNKRWSIPGVQHIVPIHSSEVRVALDLLRVTLAMTDPLAGVLGEQLKTSEESWFQECAIQTLSVWYLLKQIYCVLGHIHRV